VQSKISNIVFIAFLVLRTMTDAFANTGGLPLGVPPTPCGGVFAAIRSKDLSKSLKNQILTAYFLPKKRTALVTTHIKSLKNLFDIRFHGKTSDQKKLMDAHQFLNEQVALTDEVDIDYFLRVLVANHGGKSPEVIEAMLKGISFISQKKILLTPKFLSEGSEVIAKAYPSFTVLYLFGTAKDLPALITLSNHPYSVGGTPGLSVDALKALDTAIHQYLYGDYNEFQPNKNHLKYKNLDDFKLQVDRVISRISRDSIEFSDGRIKTIDEEWVNAAISHPKIFERRVASLLLAGMNSEAISLKKYMKNKNK